MAENLHDTIDWSSAWQDVAFLACTDTKSAAQPRPQDYLRSQVIQLNSIVDGLEAFGYWITQNMAQMARLGHQNLRIDILYSTLLLIFNSSKQRRDLSGNPSSQLKLGMAEK